MTRAVKHYMIAAGAGNDVSLENIRQLYMLTSLGSEFVSKEDFEKAARAHKEASDEMKSEQREAATKDLSFMCRSGPGYF